MKSLILFLVISVAAFISMNEDTNRDYDASVETEIITMNNIENAVSDVLPVEPCSESATNSSEPCTCIAAGGCKAKLAATCTIVFCDGHVYENDNNRTVDDDKIFTVQQPCEN